MSVSQTIETSPLPFDDCKQEPPTTNDAERVSSSSKSPSHHDLSCEAASIFDKLADSYQCKFMDVSLYTEGFRDFLSHVPSRSQLLDLACGPGNVAKYVFEQRIDIHYYLGCDLAPNMVELAQKNNPQADFKVLDIRQCQTIQHTFAGILLCFAIPYLSKLETMDCITKCCHLLDDQGVMYISTMEDSHDKSSYQKSSSGDEIYVNYHEASYLIDTLKHAGMKIIREERKRYQHNGKATCDLILIAKKQTSESEQ